MAYPAPLPKFPPYAMDLTGYSQIRHMSGVYLLINYCCKLLCSKNGLSELSGLCKNRSWWHNILQRDQQQFIKVLLGQTAFLSGLSGVLSSFYKPRENRPLEIIPTFARAHKCTWWATIATVKAVNSFTFFSNFEVSSFFIIFIFQKSNVSYNRYNASQFAFFLLFWTTNELEPPSLSHLPTHSLPPSPAGRHTKWNETSFKLRYYIKKTSE